MPKRNDTKAEILKQILSLDERRAANDVAFAMGKFGAAWVFDCMAEVFEEITEDPDRACCEKVQAQDRVKLLKACSSMFKV